MFDKFLFGNKQIPEMYFGNIPVAQIYFGNTLVWEKFVKQLVAGDTAVAIQYKPTADISVTDIGIFTAESVTNRTAKIKVFHESGLCVAAVNGDAKTSGETLYDLQGDKRDTVINATTLYAGQTYYIVYYGGQSSDSEHKFYPAYFQNSSGKGVWREYANNNDVPSVIYQSPATGEFKGVLNNQVGIISFVENDIFTWYNNGGYSPGFSDLHVYKRTAVGDGAHYNMAGAIGTPGSYHWITASDLQQFLSIPYSSEKPYEFLWGISDFDGMTNGDIWAKTSNKTAETVTTIDLSVISYNDRCKNILYVAYSNPDDDILITNGEIDYQHSVGWKFKLKSDYTNFVSSLEPVSEPSSPANKSIYYLASGTWSTTGQHRNEGVYVYDNGNWTEIYDYSGLSTVFIFGTIKDWMTFVGQQSQLATDIGTALDVNFITAQDSTTRKYYLKINGNEV